jgi:hypothetical protein
MRIIVRRCNRAPLRGTWPIPLVEAGESGGGLTICVVGGDELATHQAFWFAWSQFHPETDHWRPPGG